MNEEELIKHCQREVEIAERIRRYDKHYLEHKLVLDKIKENKELNKKLQKVISNNKRISNVAEKRYEKILKLEQENEQYEKAIKEAIKLIHKHIKEIEKLKLRIYPKEYYELLEILNIDKGDES